VIEVNYLLVMERDTLEQAVAQIKKRFPTEHRPDEVWTLLARLNEALGKEPS
jgi:hypothetical protein